MSDWYQQTLTPPDVIEVRIRLGIVVEASHAQAMVELVDPMSGVQIARWSAPHARADAWMMLLQEATDKAAQYLGDHLEPF